MAKPELGTKRLCGACGAKFYDLNKSPSACPKCGTVFEAVAAVSRARPDAAARAPVRAAEPEAAELPDVEFVSLEDADAEAQGAKKSGKAAEVPEVEDDVEIDESLDDAAFIEETEEEDEDVSDIIGGDVENEDET